MDGSGITLIILDTYENFSKWNSASTWSFLSPVSHTDLVIVIFCWACAYTYMPMLCKPCKMCITYLVSTKAVVFSLGSILLPNPCYLLAGKAVTLSSHWNSASHSWSINALVRATWPFSHQNAGIQYRLQFSLFGLEFSFILCQFSFFFHWFFYDKTKANITLCIWVYAQTFMLCCVWWNDIMNFQTKKKTKCTVYQ